jgi:hypothetical protein
MAVVEERKPITLRGSVLKHNIKAILNLHGKAGWEKVKSHIAPPILERIEKATVLEPLEPEIFAALHEALRQVYGGDHWEASFAVGSEAARVEFGGVYRVILRAVQYDTIWDRIERTWNHIVGAGAFRWIERREGFVSAEIVGVTGFHPGLWASAAGRAERLLIMSGAKSASVTMLQTTPTRATFEAYWVA